MRDKTKTSETAETEESGEPFSAAQQEWLTGLVNRVFTGRSSRDKQADAKAMGEMLGEHLGKLKEELKGEILGSNPQDVETPSGKKKVDSEIAAQMDALKKQNDRIMRQLEEERAEKTRIEQVNWESSARGALASALRKAGVNNDDLLAGATELLYKRVEKNKDTGHPVIKVPRDGYEDELDIEKFVTSEWSKGQGKAFLPAKAAAGSGGQRISNGASRGAMDGDALTQMRNRALSAMESLSYGQFGDADD